jgi:hypothetical protein
MYPNVDRELGRQAQIEARRMRSAQSPDVAIREADPSDIPALARLADLDSRHMPAGKLLVAKADGQIRAAIGIADGAVISDPFVSTGALVDLLRLRVLQVRHETRRERRRRGLLGGLRLRLGGAAS